MRIGETRGGRKRTLKDITDTPIIVRSRFFFLNNIFHVFHSALNPDLSRSFPSERWISSVSTRISKSSIYKIFVKGYECRKQFKNVRAARDPIQLLLAFLTSSKLDSWELHRTVPVELIVGEKAGGKNNPKQGWYPGWFGRRAECAMTKNPKLLRGKEKVKSWDPYIVRKGDITY